MLEVALPVARGMVPMSEQVEGCARCQCHSDLRLRTFSDQAFAALLVWRELDRSSLGKPICGDCYAELREVLIDRAGELEAASQQPIPKEGIKLERHKAPMPMAAGAEPAGGNGAKSQHAVLKTRNPQGLKVAATTQGRGAQPPAAAAKGVTGDRKTSGAVAASGPGGKVAAKSSSGGQKQNPHKKTAKPSEKAPAATSGAGKKASGPAKKTTTKPAKKAAKKPAKAAKPVKAKKATKKPAKVPAKGKQAAKKVTKKSAKKTAAKPAKKAAKKAATKSPKKAAKKAAKKPAKSPAKKKRR